VWVMGELTRESGCVELLPAATHLRAGRGGTPQNASVLEQDRAEQKRRYNSALKTDRPAADSKDIKDK
jgi:hypothetical protein